MVVKFAVRWSLAWILSLLAIWAITAVFTENFVPRVWVDELDRNVPKPGWTFQNRTEAMAPTTFGELGLPGIRDLAGKEVPKILIWGDSFVEGFQVKESLRMHLQLEQMLKDYERQNLQVVGVGRRFQSFADYIFQIPVYEPLIHPCRLHVIHLHTLEDIYPDQEFRISRFRTEPELHFERFDNEFGEIESPETGNPLKDAAYRLRTQFFLKTKTNLTKILRLEGLRFSLGEQSGPPPPGAADVGSNRWDEYLAPDWISEAAPRSAWEFAIESLKEVTQVPVLIVYAPPTPTLERGRFVTENPEAELVGEFRRICEERAVGFVDVSRPFSEFHLRTGDFPRGFHTSRPWEGHYNADGHRIVAEAITQWIKENPDVVHPD